MRPHARLRRLSHRKGKRPRRGPSSDPACPGFRRGHLQHCPGKTTAERERETKGKRVREWFQNAAVAAEAACASPSARQTMRVEGCGKLRALSSGPGPDRIAGPHRPPAGPRAPRVCSNYHPRDRAPAPPRLLSLFLDHALKNESHTPL